MSKQSTRRGGEDGIGMLAVSTTNIGAHTFAERPGAVHIPVRVRALDSFLEEHGIDHVDLIKIDVEYREADVLRGARKTIESSPGLTVLFEETAGLDTAESARFLKSLGFGVEKLGRNICLAERDK